MSGTQGLNFGAIKQNLQATGEEGTVVTNFATENYVDQQISDRFDPVPNVNFSVTLNGGISVFASGGSNETVVEFGLSASLGNLNDVNLNTSPPVTGEYLQWNGTSWVSGSGASVFPITSLTDFQEAPAGGLLPDSFLKVNSAGSSIVMEVQDVVSRIYQRSGIQVESNNGEYFIESNIPNLTRAYTADDAPDNYFSVAVNSNTDTRRMMKSDISLEGFDKGTFMRNSDFSTSVTAGSSNILQFAPEANGTGTLTLDMSTILTTTGGGGVLPISQGGTGGGTSNQARFNLGVSYNSDVIRYRRGDFQDTLFGDNIRLFDSTDQYSYLNFGLSSRLGNSEDGCGFRFDTTTSTLEFREGLGTCYNWGPFTNRFGVSELIGVCQSSFNALSGGELLIYDGVSELWNARSTSGPVQLSSEGVFSLSGISPQTIEVNSGDPDITIPEFSTLTGMNSAYGTIQEQLNKKIEVSASPSQGDIIYYTGTCPSGAKDFDIVARSGTSVNFLNMGTTIPEYNNLYLGFEQETGIIPSGSRFCILDETPPEAAKSYNLDSTVDYLTGVSGGIGQDTQSKLALDYLKLQKKTTVNSDDLIAVGISNGSGISPVQSITVNDFVSQIAGTGVCGSTGQLNLSVRISENPSTLTPSGTDGELAYFYNATAPGTSVLAVFHAASGGWLGTTLSAVTPPP